MPLFPINLTTPVSGAPLDRLANKPHLPESEKIAEASRQFEAVLLRQILASARRTVIESDLNSPSTASDVYNDMVNDILATTISQTGAFGLANALQAQWLPDSPAAPPVTPGIVTPGGTNTAPDPAAHPTSHSARR